MRYYVKVGILIWAFLCLNEHEKHDRMGRQLHALGNGYKALA